MSREPEAYRNHLNAILQVNKSDRKVFSLTEKMEVLKQAQFLQEQPQRWLLPLLPHLRETRPLTTEDLQQKTDADSCFVLIEGTVWQKGEALPLQPGAWLGLEGQAQATSYTITGPVHLLALERDRLFDWIALHPEVADEMVEVLQTLEASSPASA